MELRSREAAHLTLSLHVTEQGSYTSPFHLLIWNKRFLQILTGRGPTPWGYSMLSKKVDAR